MRSTNAESSLFLRSAKKKKKLYMIDFMSMVFEINVLLYFLKERDVLTEISLG